MYSYLHLYHLFQGGKTIANKSKRFRETIPENPGPGQYHVERYSEFRQTRSAPGAGDKDKTLGVSLIRSALTPFLPGNPHNVLSEFAYRIFHQK